MLVSKTRERVLRNTEQTTENVYVFLVPAAWALNWHNWPLFTLYSIKEKYIQRYSKNISYKNINV